MAGEAEISKRPAENHPRGQNQGRGQGWPGPYLAKIRKIAGWRSRAIGLFRANPSPGTVWDRRVIAKESNLSPIGGRRGQNLLATFGKAPKKSKSGSGPWVAGSKSGPNLENRGMAISSHRPFKGQPVSGNCQASPSNRERIESQPCLLYTSPSPRD